jgi:hypothetical protein
MDVDAREVRVIISPFMFSGGGGGRVSGLGVLFLGLAMVLGAFIIFGAFHFFGWSVDHIMDSWWGIPSMLALFVVYMAFCVLAGVVGDSISDRCYR